MWVVISILGLFMVARGVWALQQAWGSPGEKVLALAFFAALTGFAGYKLVLSLAPPAPGFRSDRRDNVVYAIVALVFVVGAVFVLVHEGATSLERLVAAIGIVFFGGGAVALFLRARRS